MTNYLGNLILNNYLIPTGQWLALHLSDPGTSGSSATEMIGGGYARNQVAWSAPSNRTTANTNAFKYLNLPAATITHLGIWDAATGGNLLYSIALPTPVVVTVGQYFTLPVHDIAVVLN
jgi:hypothetical protein